MYSFPENYQQSLNNPLSYYQIYWNFPMNNFVFYQEKQPTHSIYLPTYLEPVPIIQKIENQNKESKIVEEIGLDIIWTPQEDLKLKQISEQKKFKWKEISKLIIGKTPKMCLDRYYILQQTESRKSWTSIEQQKLKQLVLLFGEHWKHISQHFPGRNPKQIRERYLNYLRPNINHGKWTEQQDSKLIEFVSVFGHRWKLIQKRLKNRSQNQIKNRYYGHIKRIMEKNLPQKNTDVNLQKVSA